MYSMFPKLLKVYVQNMENFKFVAETWKHEVVVKKTWPI